VLLLADHASTITEAGYPIGAHVRLTEFDWKKAEGLWMSRERKANTSLQSSI